MSKYLFFILFGVILFMLYNSVDGFSIGVKNPGQDCINDDDCNLDGGDCLDNCSCFQYVCVLEETEDDYILRLFTDEERIAVRDILASQYRDEFIRMIEKYRKAINIDEQYVEITVDNPAGSTTVQGVHGLASAWKPSIEYNQLLPYYMHLIGLDTTSIDFGGSCNFGLICDTSNHRDTDVRGTSFGICRLLLEEGGSNSITNPTNYTPYAYALPFYDKDVNDVLLRTQPITLWHIIQDKYTSDIANYCSFNEREALIGPDAYKEIVLYPGFDSLNKFHVLEIINGVKRYKSLYTSEANKSFNLDIKSVNNKLYFITDIMPTGEFYDGYEQQTIISHMETEIDIIKRFNDSINELQALGALYNQYIKHGPNYFIDKNNIQKLLQYMERYNIIKLRQRLQQQLDLVRSNNRVVEFPTLSNVFKKDDPIYILNNPGATSVQWIRGLITDIDNVGIGQITVAYRFPEDTLQTRTINIHGRRMQDQWNFYNIDEYVRTHPIRFFYNKLKITNDPEVKNIDGHDFQCIRLNLKIWLKDISKWPESYFVIGKKVGNNWEFTIEELYRFFRNTERFDDNKTLQGTANERWVQFMNLIDEKGLVKRRLISFYCEELLKLEDTSCAPSQSGAR